MILRYLLSLIAVFTISISNGQSLLVTENADFEFPEQTYETQYFTDAFDLISEKSDLKHFGFVATIQCTDQYLGTCFTRIKRKARKLGANSFEYISYEYNEEKEEEVLTLKVYFASGELLVQNSLMYDSNEVVLFADSYKNYSFFVNGEKVALGYDTYYSFQLEENVNYYISSDDEKPKRGGQLKIGDKALPIYVGLGEHHIALDGNQSLTAGGAAFGILAGVLTGTGFLATYGTQELPQNYALLLKLIKENTRQ